MTKYSCSVHYYEEDSLDKRFLKVYSLAQNGVAYVICITISTP